MLHQLLVNVCRDLLYNEWFCLLIKLLDKLLFVLRQFCHLELQLCELLRLFVTFLQLLLLVVS